jgi:ligand-binding sensor domain-containing protein/two-component sensor histidine kinase
MRTRADGVPVLNCSDYGSDRDNNKESHYRMKGFIVISIILLRFLFGGNAFAQHYNFINYSTGEGLAQSQVRSIAQDRNGYLWLGTLAGLSRYDGHRFVSFSVKNGLLANQITALIPDNTTGLWIGTMGGINHFDGKRFSSHAFREDMSENMVNALSLDRSGNLWIATDGAGAVRFDGHRFTYFTEENGLAHNSVRWVCTDDHNIIWFGTRGGICAYDGKKFSRPDTLMSPPENVSHILQDRRGRLWFSTFGEGVYVLQDGRYRHFTETDGLVSNWIRSAVQDSEGNLWFASKFGLSKYDGRSFMNFTEAEGLPVDNTNIVFEDKERNLWIGSEGKGLCKFLGETFTYLTTRDQLSSNIVLSILEDAQHDLWFSTYGKGITRKSRDKVTVYTVDDGLTNNTVWASLRDRDNNLWFCTSDGVSRFNGKGFAGYGAEQGLDARSVYSVCQDTAGKLWFGTTHGVSVWDGKRFKNFINGVDPIGKDVTSIVCDRGGKLWFATKNGLYCYINNGFVRYTKTQGLSDNAVSSIAVDNGGNLWIGSAEGLTFYDGRTFSTIQIGDVFSSNTICFLVFDNKGQLWIGTNSGIFTLDSREYTSTHRAKLRQYTIYDGLPGMECNLNAAYKDHAGQVWMGTTDGLIKYDPFVRDFHAGGYEPVTHISGVRLFLKDTNWHKFTKDIDPVTHLPRNLKVNYNASHFTFDYIGIKLTNPTSVRYRYMLEGFDEGWSAPSDVTFATYSNLSSGKYIFKVIAGDVMGNWNKVPATFAFEILPPFWTRWWFVLLCVIAAGFILAGIYRWRVSELRKKHLTHQLEYKSRLMVLEHQALKSSMNRHFIFNALNSIQYYMNQEDKHSAHKYLTRFAKLIRMNLDSSMNNVVSVSEEIERLQLYLELEKMRFNDKFDYQIIIAEDIDPENTEIPPMILQPYVENSILHGILPSLKNGNIEIRVEHNSEGQIVFSVEDNGIGLEASENRKKDRAKIHVSRGTSIIVQRIHLLGKMNDIHLSIHGPYDLKGPDNEILGTRVELILK